MRGPYLFVLVTAAMLSAPSTASAQLASNLIQSDEPFSPGGRPGPRRKHIGNALAQELAKEAGLAEQFNRRTEREITSSPKVEHGNINGVLYEIHYKDGSGTFSGEPETGEELLDRSHLNWKVGCNKDVITDAITCFMHIKDFWLIAQKAGGEVLRVGKDHYPNTTIAIRIESEEPYVSNADTGGQFSVAVSADILAELSNGKVIATRYMEWPYQSWRDQKWSLYGFEEAYDYVKWALEHIN